MMRRYGMDMAGTCEGYGMDTDFTRKSKVLDMILHDSLPILKYPGIIACSHSNTRRQKYFNVKIIWQELIFTRVGLDVKIELVFEKGGKVCSSACLKYDLEQGRMYLTKIQLLELACLMCIFTTLC